MVNFLDRCKPDLGNLNNFFFNWAMLASRALQSGWPKVLYFFQSIQGNFPLLWRRKACSSWEVQSWQCRSRTKVGMNYFEASVAHRCHQSELEGLKKRSEMYLEQNIQSSGNCKIMLSALFESQWLFAKCIINSKYKEVDYETKLKQ